MVDESTKTRIVRAAGPIFAERGFDHATVREICGAADVNVASIKYYFGDKKNLYLETVREARNMRAERYPFPPMAAETSAEEKLYDFVSALLRRLTALQAAPWQVKLLMRELMDPTDACRMLVKDYFRPMFDSLLDVVDQLVDQPLEPHERLKAGFSIIGQCLHYRYASEVVSLMVPVEQRSAFEVEQIADHITRFCLSGLQGYSADARKIPQDQGSTPEHPPEQ